MESGVIPSFEASLDAARRLPQGERQADALLVLMLLTRVSGDSRVFLIDNTRTGI